MPHAIAKMDQTIPGICHPLPSMKSQIASARYNEPMRGQPMRKALEGSDLFMVRIICKVHRNIAIIWLKSN